MPGVGELFGVWGWTMGGNWRRHPGVRSEKGELSIGERAADRMRNGMGSWAFVFGAMVFLGAWMVYNGNHGFDAYPFILLNLILSCLAAMQGAILLIAAKRADQISSELAQHDYAADQESRDILRAQQTLIATMAEQHAALYAQMAAMVCRCNAASV